MSGNVIGGVIGAAIGFVVGGPAGAQWGWMIGSVAGGLLMPPEMEGPRLDDKRPQGSEYGRPIPIVYGTGPVQGNVIWQTDLIEVASESGGKGGPEVTNYTYYANFAVLLCEGEVELGRIWAGPEKRLIYDGVSLEGGTLTFYNGSETQLPDPLMESYEGVGAVPGYRGWAYLVFEMFPVANDGNRIPFLQVEVGKVTTALSLGIVWDVGQILIDEAAGTYTVSYSGSFDGNITRSLADNSFVSQNRWANGTGYVGNVNSFLDPDRDRVFYIDTSGVFWADIGSAATGGFDVFGSWPGLVGAGWRPVGGVYHNGFYYFLMHNVGGTGVAISVLDPDDLTVSVGFYQGDAGFASGGLAHFCDHRQDGDAYILGATKAGTIRKFPLGDGFTSVSCGASLVDPHYVAVDPNTGYVWSMIFDSGNLTVSANDPVTESQLYTETIVTDAWATTSGARRSFPFVFGNGKVLVIMQKWLALDYFAEFAADPPAWTQNIQGRYHGTGDINSGIWNAAQNKYWFMRSYAWFDSPVTDNDLTYVGLWSNDGTPTPGFYLGDTGVIVDGQPLYEIVQDLCVRADMDPSEIDVTQLTDTVDGYVINQQTTVRGAIQVLQPVYYFDCVESLGVAKFVKRGGAPVVTIPNSELGAYNSGSDFDKDLLLIQRQMEDELPAKLTVSYMSRATKYDTATKQAERQIGSSGDEQSIEVPVVLTDTKGLQVAEVNIHKAWVGRKTFSFNLPLKYTYLEPTDVITIRGQTMMLTKVSQDGGVLKCEGVFDRYDYSSIPVVVTETPSDGYGGVGSVYVPSPTRPVLMNLVALRTVDTDAGFYAAACGTTPTLWRGSVLYQSKDGGATYNPVGKFTTAAVIGSTSGALADYTGGDAIDTVSTVNVVLAAGGTLSSVTEDAFLAGANACAIGNQDGDFEIVYFRYATLESDGSYTLNRLMRGRLGSAYALGGHAVGDQFVLLNTSSVIRVSAEPTDIGQSYLYKAVSVGSTLADTLAFAFIDTGRSYSPSTPVDVAQPATLYGRDPSTTTGLTWGYYGGAKLKSDGTIVLINAGTVNLTDNATNYIYATDAGAVVVTTAAPAGWPAPLAANATALYEVVVANGVVTSYIDYRTAGGGGGGGGGSSPTTTKGDLIVNDGSADDRLPVGTNGQRLVADSTQPLGVKWASDPFDVAAFYPAIPPGGTKMTRIPMARAVTFSANFAGSYGKASVAATASTAFDIQKNGVSVGTATFAAGSATAIFVSSGGAAVSFVAGDVLSIVAPTPDATLYDVGFMLAGTR